MATHTLYILLILYFFHICSADICEKRESEKPAHLKLREELLCGYDKTIRPVKDNTNSTIIKLFLFIRHFDFNEYGASISVEGLLAMRWKDEHLKWVPSDYDNIRRIYLTANEIWTPDMSLYNKPSLYGGAKILNDESLCIIGNDTYVNCIPIVSLDAVCMPDLTYWPFDSHNCTISVGSWTHNGEEINFNSTIVDKYYKYFSDNKQWAMTSMKVTKDRGKLDCCPNNTYPSLNFQFIIKRRAASSIISYLLPYFVMVTMTLMAIWLDPKSPDRIYLTALNIPCHLLFLHNTSWELPETGDTLPYLIALLRDSLLLATITLIETLLVRALLNTRKDSPHWLVISFSALVNSKPGQMILFSELNPQGAAGNITADDSSNLVEVGNNRPREWYLLGRIIDRMTFVIYIMVYIILILLSIPK